MTDIEKIKIGLRDIITRIFIDLTDNEIKDYVDQFYGIYKDWDIKDFQKLCEYLKK